MHPKHLDKGDRVVVQDKTLVIGPAWVGDMVMSQSLLMAIKAHYPQTLIDVMAPAWSRPLTERMPQVNQGLTMPLGHGELNLIQRYQLGKVLRTHQYQRCFILPNSFKSALIPFWAKIPQRIGWRGEWRYGLLNEVHVLDKKRYPLMVERYIALVCHPTADLVKQWRPALKVEQQNVQVALAKYQLSLLSPVLILCPGAEFGPSKRWPSEYYAKVANEYLHRQWQVWILGSAKDTVVSQEIQNLTQQRCIDLTGRTNLAEAIDLMSVARLVLSNDSGLMHIAAALDRHLVAVYGSTDPGFTPPLNDNVAIVKESLTCSPCFKRTCPLQHHACMQKLTPNKVLAAMENITSV